MKTTPKKFESVIELSFDSEKLEEVLNRIYSTLMSIDHENIEISIQDLSESIKTTN